MMKRAYILASLLCALALPTIASAQTTEVAFTEPVVFQRNGIFGCSIDGSHSMSVGALGAVGGLYVPVNDAAVTLNTGYLVYKECVLRGVVNRQREAASAEATRKVLVDYSTVRNGNPLYSQLLPREETELMNEYVLETMQGETLNALHPRIKDPVARAIVYRYVQSVNTPSSVYACNYRGNLDSVFAGRPSGSPIGALGVLSSPCNPLIAFEYANEVVLGGAEAAADNLRTKLAWGRGTYPVETRDANGNYITVTPASIVEGNVMQALQSGFRQLENANDIDQMVGALFSGMAAQVIGDSRGLAGLIQQSGSQQSYLDQVVREAGTGLRNAAANAALQVIASKLTIEEAYRSVMRSIGILFADTRTALLIKERQCWQLIVERVCSTDPAADRTCNATMGGGRLRVATTTAESTSVINAQIRSDETTVTADVSRSDATITELLRLIRTIRDTSTPAAQVGAMATFENPSFQARLHNQGHVTEKQRLKDLVEEKMRKLIEDTLRSWTESENPDIGWCNVTSDEVLQKWTDEWRI